jgi:phosphopantetheine adenylyltransferase
MKDKTVLELATRLNEIEKELNELQIEYNRIVKELWDRIPTTKTDESIQMKKRIKTKED